MQKAWMIMENVILDEHDSARSIDKEIVQEYGHFESKDDAEHFCRKLGGNERQIAPPGMQRAILKYEVVKVNQAETTK